MDYLPDYETLSQWLLNYGSIAIFVLLALGIIALPVPEETLMVFTGAAMANNTLPVGNTVIAAYLGSVTGITMSYFLGRTAGYYFIHRYGSWLGLTETKLEKAHQWFERFGKWSLFIGYFIPGVRHFTGLCAGATELDFRTFALFAYLGALFWVSTFLSIGYFYCEYCFSFFEHLELSFATIMIASLIALMAIVYYFYRRGQTK